MIEELLLEKKLTTEFTFGFELEANANGMYNFDEHNNVTDFIESYMGEGGDFHSDASLEVDEGCIEYYDKNDFYYESENMTLDELLDNFQATDIEKLPIQTPFEYASPVLSFNIENIQKVINMLNEGIKSKIFTTNESCGFHHHLSFKGITGEDAAWIVSQLACDEEARKMFKEFKTVTSEGNEINYNFITTWSEEGYLYDLKSAIRIFDFNEIIKLLNTDKYSILNVHKNKTLEWRGPRDFLNTQDRKVIVDFYKKLWKVVNWMTSALDKKDINGMDKNIYLKNLIIDNDNKPLSNFPEFTINKDANELSSETVDKLTEKVINEPSVLINLSSKRRPLDQIIQKLFNTSKLGRTIDKLAEMYPVYPKVINDIAYKYIPAKMYDMASSDAIYNTSEKTLKRLINSRYGLGDGASLQDRLTYLVPKMNTELFRNWYEISLSLIKNSDFKLFNYIIENVDESNVYGLVDYYIDSVIHNGAPIEYIDDALNKLKENEKQEMLNRLRELVAKIPSLIKYIDNIDKEFIIAMIGYSMRVGNYDEVKNIILSSGKVSKKTFEELESKFTAYYKHDLNDDFELEQ